ncbi:ATP-binding protein [Reinekea blandensis]|uniref:Serine phosphatase RsbU, regulator of sigma subunit n=1 Tax=Reinekea blandensis MED297 TaxID=314283 RepID=A4BH98_9GAMM|nr:ATP-binding protein [Reinekea blandensis]EAR08446.1 Serine phosphatase RsbU, regulator of sigma subunit [Reinekea sp. MED297] [Reinekea blandensis MED297]
MSELIEEFEVFASTTLDDISARLEVLVAIEQLPNGLVSDVLIILDELISNLFKYGGGKRLEVKLYKSADVLEVRCKDDGAPFNPLMTQRPDLEVPMEDRAIGGLGLELVLAMTDSQNYHYDGNCNHLTLTLSLS